MVNSAPLSDFLSSIALRGRAIIGLRPISRQETSSEGIVELCRNLLTSRGDASGIALSNEALSAYEYLDNSGKLAFFNALYEDFTADPERTRQAASAYLADPSQTNLSSLSAAAEPSRRRLIIRLNQAPNATLRLIRMRTDLLRLAQEHRHLREVDRDFSKLFTSWFNGGFLQLRRLDWSTPASILENIIRYEAVHGMSGWDDLRERLDPPDRRIYGFFHPRLNDEPLIFIEVALMEETPSSIQAVLGPDRKRIDPAKAKTAVFYSISNCQDGLRGIPLGSFLIKRVVEDLQRSLPQLKRFITLSPAPGFAAWLDRMLLNGRAGEAGGPSQSLYENLASIRDNRWIDDPARMEQLKDTITSAAAFYFTSAKNANAQPLDPVARFHLGNGAQLERINWPADLSAHGLKQAYGVMVNYQYHLGDIERNNERFSEQGEVCTSTEVAKLARQFKQKANPLHLDAA